MEGGLTKTLEEAKGSDIHFAGLADFHQAVAHAVLGGGKRVRPCLTLLCAQACGMKDPAHNLDALRAALAIELLHCYTLVHDDLPAMDNDTERRGRPSVWAKFGEANAILVGDYLQALSFKTLPTVSGKPLAAILAKGAGHFPDTSIWDGNCCIAGHNRGIRDDFGDLHTLEPGDTITWTTKLGTRTYEVTSVQKVKETDTSGTAAATDNRITLFTCVRGERAYRWQVQAVEK